MTEEKIRYRDMDEKQKREYKKEKERDRRNKMSVEQKEYERISDKHRKRVERLNRDEEKHSEDNLKAKDAMRLMRENLSDEYIPRGRQNIKEEDEWKIFFDTNQESKL
jgi:hypothetical protein